MLLQEREQRITVLGIMGTICYVRLGIKFRLDKINPREVNDKQIST